MPLSVRPAAAWRSATLVPEECGRRPRTVAVAVEPNTERLKQILRQPEPGISLAEAALVIARDEYPALDVDAYLRRLDELAARVRAGLPPTPGLEEMIVTLNHFLFVEQGFAGDTDNFYDPRNSFLNEVLDRRRGIPITLSILYLEIGTRLGLELEGISFPATSW